MSRRAGATGRSDSNTRHRSGHTPGPMALVWITVARAVMAIVLGLTLALHGGRAAAPRLPGRPRPWGSGKLHGRLLDPHRHHPLPGGPGAQGPTPATAARC